MILKKILSYKFMKKIFFEQRIYLLTDLEFEKAVKTWKKNGKYWCKRLEALISDKFLFAETPRGEVGYKVYLYKNKNGTLGKIFERNNKFYKEIQENNCKRKILIEIDNKFKQRMIEQEKFYNSSGESKIVDKKRLLETDKF